MLSVKDGFVKGDKATFKRKDVSWRSSFVPIT